MPSSVPTPVAAALGIVPTVLGGVRRLPGRAVQLPVFAVSSALAGLDLARREYDDLAARGERLLARLRGASFDDLEDRVEDSLQGTPLARPYDAAEDALEDAGEAISTVAKRAAGSVRGGTRRVSRTAGAAAGSVTDLSQKAAQRTGGPAGTVAGTAGQAVDEAEQAVAAAEHKTRKAAKRVGRSAGRAAGATADTAPEPAPAQQPKTGPTPKATQPDDTRIDTAATSDVVETVEQVAARTGSGQVLEHDQLPLPDYDHMTLGSLRGRLRSLTVDQLVQLRDYEKGHADRLPVVTMLDNRIAKLASDSSEQPSGVPSERPAAGQSQSSTGSKVQPGTGGPAQNPPSHGDPTNPAQPRSGGSGSTNPS
jgi:hypothetical protein